MANEMTFGQTDWNDEEGISTPNDFLNLAEGDNEIRVISKPNKFYVSWVQDASGSPRKVKSAVKNCPLVKRGEKVSPRWMIKVLSRKTNQPKILEISTQVFVQIKDLVNNPRWGDITRYDINIKRRPKNSQPLYVVTPYAPSDLTAEEKAVIAKFNERVDLNKFTQPPTPEEVLEKLRDLGVEDTVSSSSNRGTSASAGAGVKDTVENEDFNFEDDDL